MLFLFLFLIIIIIEASSSSIFFSLFSFLCFIFCLFFLNRKKLAIVALLFLFFFSILFQFSKYQQRLEIGLLPAKNNYELSIRYLNNIFYTFSKIYFFIHGNLHSKLGEFSEYYTTINDPKKDHVHGFLKRISHSCNVLFIVLKKTPEKINYYYGKSYEGIVYKLIPRILIPSKPEELWGSFWGKRYEVLDKNDNITSWNFPVLAEFYANFGIIGSALGMFLIGCFTRIISIPITNNKNTMDGNLISISIFFQFIYQEINLTLVLGNVYVSLILTLIVIFTTNKIFKT